MKTPITASFKARWNLGIQISTVIWLIALSAMCLLAIRNMHGKDGYYVVAAVGMLIVWNLLTCVRGYRIRGAYIEVLRPLWVTRINARKLRKIRLDPNAMQGSIPVFANLGLFSFNGWFHSEKYGLYRAFVTDRSCVVRVKIGRIAPLYMFSPDEPERFLMVLRENTREPQQTSNQAPRSGQAEPERVRVRGRRSSKDAEKPSPQARS